MPPTARAMRRGAAGAVGSPIIGYGHSYMAGSAASTTPNRQINRLAAALGSPSIVNRGIGGLKAINIYENALPGQAQAWTPGTKGLVVWDGTINEIYGGDGTKDLQAQRRLAAGLRSFLRLIQCSSIVGTTDASLAYTGGWGTFSGTPGGVAVPMTARNSSSASEVITISGYTGTEIIIRAYSWHGQNSAATGSNDGVGGSWFKVSVNGTEAARFTTSDGDASYAEGTYRVTGMPAGTKTITISPVAGGGFPTYFCGYMTPSAASPSILLLKETHLPNNGYNGGGAGYTQSTGDTSLDAMNATIDAIVAEAEFGGFVKVADPTSLMNPATMFNADNLHPNDAGHAARAAAALVVADSLPRRPGLSY